MKLTNDTVIHANTTWGERETERVQDLALGYWLAQADAKRTMRRCGASAGRVCSWALFSARMGNLWELHMQTTNERANAAKWVQENAAGIYERTEGVTES
jgi:hypothetical protein